MANLKWKTKLPCQLINFPISLLTCTCWISIQCKSIIIINLHLLFVGISLDYFRKQGTPTRISCSKNSFSILRLFFYIRLSSLHTNGQSFHWFFCWVRWTINLVGWFDCEIIWFPVISWYLKGGKIDEFWYELRFYVKIQKFRYKSQGWLWKIIKRKKILQHNLNSIKNVFISL